MPRSISPNQLVYLDSIEPVTYKNRAGSIDVNDLKARDLSTPEQIKNPELYAKKESAKTKKAFDQLIKAHIKGFKGMTSIVVGNIQRARRITEARITAKYDNSPKTKDDKENRDYLIDKAFDRSMIDINSLYRAQDAFLQQYRKDGDNESEVAQRYLLVRHMLNPR